MKKFLPILFTSMLFVCISFDIAMCKEYDFQRFFSKKVRLEPGTVVVLDNPVGEIHLTNIDPQLGPYMMVKQRVFAAADELAKCRYMVMTVRMDISRRPDTLALDAIFPTHMYEKFCFPDMSGFFGSEVSKIWKGSQFIVSPRKGVKLWSDVYLEVPKGTKVLIRSVAMGLVIEDFVGDLELYTDHASAMTAGSIDGNLWLTACHGALSVGGFKGDLFYYGEDSDLSFCDVINGKISAESVSGDLIWTATTDSLEILELKSISGNIILDGEVGENTVLLNDEGDIEIILELPIGDSLYCTNPNGDIYLKAPENFAKTIKARASEGRIKHNLTGDDKSISTQLKGSQGAVVLDSERGDIKIKLISID